MVLTFTFNTIIFLELICIWHGNMLTILFNIGACFPHLILLTLVYFLFYIYHSSYTILYSLCLSSFSSDQDVSFTTTPGLASGPTTSWEIDGETVETVSDFIFLGSKITADGDCSHEIKRGLLLGRKVMTNLDSIFKSRDITLPTKVHLVKAIVYSVVMYGCEI